MLGGDAQRDPQAPAAQGNWPSLLGPAEELLAWGGFALEPARRQSSSSGGLLTVALTHLLEAGRVDAAVVVARAERASHPLFEARLARSREELEDAAGSKYYPVELSRPLREVLRSGERVAVVGLPCHCRALRAAMRAVPPLREQVAWLFGLACGHEVTTAFTDVLLARAGVSVAPGDGLFYRRKAEGRTAFDYRFVAERDGRQIGRPVAWHGDIYHKLWLGRLFVPRVCDFCADGFAECADATFMDAWLPDYTGDWRGTSLAVTRTPQAAHLLRELTERGLVKTWPVAPDDVVRSQVAVVRHKRDLVPARAHAAAARGQAVPQWGGATPRAGTRAELAEIARYDRNRRVARTVWRMPLPASLRIRLLAWLTRPR